MCVSSKTRALTSEGAKYQYCFTKFQSYLNRAHLLSEYRLHGSCIKIRICLKQDAQHIANFTQLKVRESTVVFSVEAIHCLEQQAAIANELESSLFTILIKWLTLDKQQAACSGVTMVQAMSRESSCLY